jgi:hypothetical protein
MFAALAELSIKDAANPLLTLHAVQANELSHRVVRQK